jgi:cytochrome c oxidase subunit 1
MTISAICLGIVQLVFAFNFFYSLFYGRKAERNPWRANTLDWEAPTPVPHGNFPQIPHVYRGPYEYSVPGEKEDFLPQAQPGRAAAH